MKPNRILLILSLLAFMFACTLGGTPTPPHTNQPFQSTPFPPMTVIFATFDPNATDTYSGHDATPPAPAAPTASSLFCPPGWYQTADGCNKESYENFALTADTCVGMDDGGKLFLIVRTSLTGEGIDLPDGLKFLSCWMDHPSDFDGYQWYTSPQLPSGIKELQLYEGDGFASINYCTGACSISEEPIWDGWVESSQGNSEIWNLDQKIRTFEAFYPDGFVGEITYDFYTR